MPNGSGLWYLLREVVGHKFRDKFFVGLVVAAFPIRGGQNFSFEQEREIALSVIHCRDRRDEAVRMGLCTKVYQKVDFNEEKHALSANARFCPAGGLTYV